MGSLLYCPKCRRNTEHRKVKDASTAGTVTYKCQVCKKVVVLRRQRRQP